MKIRLDKSVKKFKKIITARKKDKVEELKNVLNKHNYY